MKETLKTEKARRLYERYIETRWVGKGWDGLVWGVIKAADELMSETPELAEALDIVDMKEKYASLRLSLAWNTSLLDELDNKHLTNVVRAAEVMSAYICEVCGKPGYQTTAGNRAWIKTLCGECATIAALRQ